MATTYKVEDWESLTGWLKLLDAVDRIGPKQTPKLIAAEKKAAAKLPAVLIIAAKKANKGRMHSLGVSFTDPGDYSVKALTARIAQHFVFDLFLCQPKKDNQVVIGQGRVCFTGSFISAPRRMSTDHVVLCYCFASEIAKHLDVLNATPFDAAEEVKVELPQRKPPTIPAPFDGAV